jgi:small nuclear ribonucleoprotein (snRNP)-like protein
VSPANLVLQDCVEREYVGQEYAEKQRGLFIVRGENVVFISQLVCARARLATRLL